MRLNQWSFILCAILFATIESIIPSSDWSYADDQDGPSHWHTKFRTCGGFEQSPVDLPGSRYKYDGELMPVRFLLKQSVDPTTLKFSLTTHGHVVRLLIPSDTYFVSFTDNNVPQYEIVMIYFRWGSENQIGSEHYLYGKSYAMETQVLAYNRISYKSLDEAKAAPGGIAIISFLHEECTDSDPRETQIGIIEGLEEALGSPKMQAPNGTTQINGFHMSSLLTQVNRGRYFRYKGSQTMPPCTENVLWTVFHETVPILQKQLDVFRRLSEKKGDKLYQMSNNFRPIQKLNDMGTFMPRKVYTSKAVPVKADLLVLLIGPLFYLITSD